MKPVPRMSDASEQRILDTLEKVAGYVTDGDSPDEAIAKAATENSVPAGHVRHLVAAYNVGRTTTQRKSGSDCWEKAATFPLANTERVLAIMYPDKVASDAVDIDYATPPDRWLSDLAAEERHAWAIAENPFQKAASEECKVEDSDGLALRKQHAILQRAKHAADEARSRATQALEKAGAAADSLVDLLRDPSAPALSEVRGNCVRLYGDIVAPLFDFVGSAAPDLTKAASRRPQPARGQVYDTVARCLNERLAYGRLKVEADTKAAEYKAAENGFQKFLSNEPKEKPVRHHPILGTVIPDEPKEEKSGGLGSIPGAIPILSSALAGQSELGKAKAQHYVGSILKPKPDAGLANELKQIQHRAVVQDLLANGISSGHDPHQVMETYKRIADVAPMAASKPAIAQDFVNRALAAGQLSYFDLEALTRLEKNMAQAANPKAVMTE